jgi:hypothetical protein
MNAEHKRALRFAARHFAIGLAAGLVCMMYFFLAGLSDHRYADTPPSIKVLMVALWVYSRAFDRFTRVPLVAPASTLPGRKTVIAIT